MPHLKYLRYLLRHKWYVLVAGLRTGTPLWRLLVHDWSKFLPSEWGPYVDYFYGPEPAVREERRRMDRLVLGYTLTRSGQEVQAEFNRAWNLHQKRQPHHWQFWVLTQDDGESFPLPIPDHFVREMVADWAGAGRAITGRWEVCSWYAKNKNRMRLRTETRGQVEQILAECFGPIPVIHTAPEPLSGGAM